MGLYTVSASWGELLGGWCNAVLYGLNILIFGSCMYILIKKRREGKHVSSIFFICAILQFLISSIHVALNLRLLMNAFLNVSDGPSASDAYLAQETIPEQIGLKALYFTNSAIGDAVLVWRMYVVWGRNAYIAILPSIMVAISAGTSIFSPFMLRHADTHMHTSAATGFVATALVARGGDTLWPNILKYLLVSWALSIATQVLATTLIAYRIWAYAARIPAHVFPVDERGGRAGYMRVVWIVVESGAVYTASTILLLVFFVLNTQASNIIGKALGQISSIVPTLIIVRVNLTSDRSKRNDKAVSIKFLNSYVPSSFLGTRQEQTETSIGPTLDTRGGLPTQVVSLESEV